MFLKGKSMYELMQISIAIHGDNCLLCRLDFFNNTKMSHFTTVICSHSVYNLHIYVYKCKTWVSVLSFIKTFIVLKLQGLNAKLCNNPISHQLPSFSFIILQKFGSIQRSD